MKYTSLLLILILSLLMIFPTTTAAQTDPIWEGEYFDNAVLSDPPVFTRRDTAIAFDWGFGSPGSDIGADNFSVRWATDVELTAGTYRFYAQADDDIEVIVDFQPIPLIDTFEDKQVGELVTADITLEGGSHHIQVDYREITAEAFAFVSFENLARNPSGPNFAPPAQLPTSLPPVVNPWQASYYNNTALAGTPVITRLENDPDHNWGAGFPAFGVSADNWSARWTRNQFLYGGQYQFEVMADDGVRLYVDNSLIIDEWHVASGQLYQTTVQLPQGNHVIVVEFYEGTGLASLSYSLTQVAAAPVGNVPTQPTATVATRLLNVRSQPTTASDVLTQISEGETYTALARNTALTWVQINVNGTVGWVNDNYVNLRNTGSLPRVGPPRAPVNEGPLAVISTGLLNVRQTPDPISGDILTQVSNGEIYPAVAWNPSRSWVQINVNGLLGWVNASYVNLENVQSLPVVP